MTVSDSAAVAASYGSVSAVTFVTAVAFLDAQKIEFGGHMVAVMAFMESPAIIVGMILMMKYAKNSESSQKLGPIVKHSFTNSSVLMILGSLVIGFVADSKQAQGIEPFTTDLFKGFLAIFLLEMGMVTAKRFKAFKQYGAFPLGFSVLTPILNGVFVAILSGLFMSNIGDRLLFTILVASASYIAVPAAMRLAAPKADPGLYIPMALGVTFPINITIGLPLYFAIIKLTV